jgi:hypothetical protein
VAEANEDPRWELVFDEAQRALTYQQGILDNLRSRATVLTAAAALVSTLLGVPALKTGQLGLASVIAIGAAALIVISTGIICAPWYSWHFTSSAKILVEAVENGYDLNEMRERLALNFDEWYEENARRLGGLQAVFTVGLSLLFIEILAWWLQVLQAGVISP